jgi:DNA-directed RNA polymerase specialized sigma24 family protein
MDIREHLAKHQDIIKAVAWWYANDVNDFEDAYQEIVALMIDRHERGNYDHSKGELHTYVWNVLRATSFGEVDKYQHFERDAKGKRITKVVPPADLDEEGISNLEELQEQDGNPDRPGSNGAPRVQPINWYGEGYGEQPSTLTPEEQELAEKLKANLTDEELKLLDASYGRSLHRAAESLDMAYATYYRKLRDARARARALAKLVAP